MVSVAQIKGLIGCAGYLCGMLAGGAGNDIYLLARGDGADRISEESGDCRCLVILLDSHAFPSPTAGGGRRLLDCNCFATQ